MRRRLRLLLGVGAVVLLGVAGFALVLWLISPTPRVSMENFRRLRKGMSERYVEALLGKPYKVTEWAFEGSTRRLWRSQEVVIELVLVADRVESGAAFPPAFTGEGFNIGPLENISTEASLLDRIRRWLDW